jgi:hypothetical protein
MRRPTYADSGWAVAGTRSLTMSSPCAAGVGQYGSSSNSQTLPVDVVKFLLSFADLVYCLLISFTRAGLLFSTNRLSTPSLISCRSCSAR